MKELIQIIIIGISLSMDAFSLSLLYGTLKLKEKEILLLSVTVGIFHFLMPLLGYNFGNLILDHIPLPQNILISIILLILGIDMIISSKKNEKESFNLLKTTGMILFGFTVSLDSFSVGIVLDYIDERHILAALIFTIVSALFTYLGLHFGKRISKKFGKYAVLFGGITLIIISITYLVK